MKKILVGLFAVLALCAFYAASAFAESEWLVNGLAVGVELSAETEGEVTLVKFEGENNVVLTKILCSGFGDGTILGKAGTGLDILDLVHNEIGTLDPEDTPNNALSCEVTFDAGALADCKVNTLASVWLIGVNLGLGDWGTGEILLNGGVFTAMASAMNNLGGTIGYKVECESLLGIKGEESCTEGSGEATLTNAATTPASVLAEATVGPLANRESCSLGGAHSGSLEGTGNTWALEGETRLETA